VSKLICFNPHEQALWDDGYKNGMNQRFDLNVLREQTLINERAAVIRERNELKARLAAFGGHAQGWPTAEVHLKRAELAESGLAAQKRVNEALRAENQEQLVRAANAERELRDYKRAVQKTELADALLNPKRHRNSDECEYSSETVGLFGAMLAKSARDFDRLLKDRGQ
jgi:hypothetical protein